MKRIAALLLLFFATLMIPAAASAALKPDDDPTIVEGLRDKGVDWLKDKASDAGKSWMFDTDQSETMHDILLKARERADGFGNDQNGLCRGAVMGKASSILNDINYKWTVKTAGRLAFDTVTKMAGLAAGFGAAAVEGDAINWLVGQYADAAKDQAKESIFDAIKKLFVDEKKPEFELYETKGTNGDCDYTLRAAWDIVHGTYRVYIAGDCHCKQVGNVGVIPRPLGKWWISFEGHLSLVVDKDKGTASWVAQTPRMDFDAQCACSDRKLREAFVEVTKEQGSRTAGGGSTAPKPPALPPAGRVVCKDCQKIQDNIDADLKALEEDKRQVQDLAEQMVAAEAALASAEGTLDAVKANPADYTITPDVAAKRLRDAQAAIDRIKAESRRLEADQVRLTQELIDLAKLLEDCIKTSCTPGHASVPKPTNEQVAVAPPAARKCDPQQLTGFASTVIALHNSERAAVGANALCWNEELAQHAAVYASELARNRQLAHSPREGRGIERENLLQALPYWGPAQMIGVWIAEKRYFKPGIFPNVCGGRDWSQCAHYTQMIWPTTTDLGCAVAAGGGFQWLVCRYSPGGNKDGKPVGEPANASERG